MFVAGLLHWVGESGVCCTVATLGWRVWSFQGCYTELESLEFVAGLLHWVGESGVCFRVAALGWRVWSLLQGCCTELESGVHCRVVALGWRA